jgi:hypothetical protein
MPEPFYFGRREDLRRPATPRESPLREFELRCHHGLKIEEALKSMDSSLAAE